MFGETYPQWGYNAPVREKFRVQNLWENAISVGNILTIGVDLWAGKKCME